MTKEKLLSLTSREKEVLTMLADGYTNKEVGTILNISHRTVEAHRARIMLKLNIHTLSGLVKYPIKENITTVDIHRDYASN